jgi:hypothetical protein
VLEANISVEEVVKLLFESAEKRVRDLILDSSREFVIKTEFFYNQIEVVHKSILNELLY